jgi:hypothetical protein
MPDILPVDAVVVSDASSLVLPNGSIARDSNNRIFVHDNKTTGGVNISGLLLRGAASYNAATDDALLDAHVLDIAEVAIPPDMFTTAGGKLSIIGRLSVVSSLTSYTPAANTKIILYWADQSGAVASNHLGWTIATAAAPAAITNLDIAAYTPATVSGGFLTLSAEQGLTRMDTASASGGTITSSSIVSATSGTSASRRVAYAGDVSRVLRLALLLPADSATADAGGLIYVHSNILLQRLDA